MSGKWEKQKLDRDRIFENDQYLDRRLTTVEQILDEGFPGGIGASQGPQGEPGESAYEIAARHGFTGTEKEWLASLKGKSYKIEFDVDLDTGTLYQYVYEKQEANF